VKTLLLGLALLLAACRSSSWAPTPLTDGYQLMVMNSKEVYVANAKNELLLGPRVKAIALAPGLIVVDCGNEKIVVNGFENTAGLNLIDTKTGAIRKGITEADLEREMSSRNQREFRLEPLSSYVKR
jgi:hypothetical protein